MRQNGHSQVLPSTKIHLDPHLQGSLQLQNNSLWQTGIFYVFFLLIEFANLALLMITSALAMLYEVLLVPSAILLLLKGLETPMPCPKICLQAGDGG